MASDGQWCQSRSITALPNWTHPLMDTLINAVHVCFRIIDIIKFEILLCSKKIDEFSDIKMSNHKATAKTRWRQSILAGSLLGWHPCLFFYARKPISQFLSIITQNLTKLDFSIFVGQLKNTVSIWRVNCCTLYSLIVPAVCKTIKRQ